MASFRVARAGMRGYRYVLVDDAGEVLLSSSTYGSRNGALRGIDSVRRNLADPARIERRLLRDGRPCFVLKARNGQVLATSPGYADARGCEAAIRRARRAAMPAASKQAASKQVASKQVAPAITEESE